MKNWMCNSISTNPHVLKLILKVILNYLIYLYPGRSVTTLHPLIMWTNTSTLHLSNEKRAPRCLGYIGIIRDYPVIVVAHLYPRFKMHWQKLPIEHPVPPVSFRSLGCFLFVGIGSEPVRNQRVYVVLIGKMGVLMCRVFHWHI